MVNLRNHIVYGKQGSIVLLILLFVMSGNLYAKQTSFDRLAEKIDSYSFSYEKRSRELLNELSEIAYNSPDSVRLIPQCLYRESSIAYALGLSDATLLNRIKERLSMIDQEEYPYEYNLLLYSLAQLQYAAGQYAEAFPNSLQVLEAFKQLNDSLFIGKSLNTLGNIYSSIDIVAMAEDYYTEALSWFNPDQPDYYGTMINLNTLSFARGDKEKMVHSLLSLIPDMEKLNNPGLLVLAHLNLGYYYWQIEDYDSIYLHCEQASAILENIDNIRLEAHLYQNYALYYYGKDNYKKALKYAYLSKDIAQSLSRDNHLITISNLMAGIYSALNNYDSAYYYSSSSQTLVSQQLGEHKIVEAYQAYVATFLEASENKLTIAQQNIALNKKQLTVTVIVFTFIALLSVLLLVILQQKRKMKENENKELARQLDLEKQIQQLMQEKQKEELESKTREITSYSLQLSNKNGVLSQILDITNQLTDNSKETLNVRKQIKSVIKNNYNLDNDWENFKIHFDQVHPDFFDKLKNYCSDLTENNLRNCAYFRLGLSTKQIAQIQNISPTSVFIHRSRLKKKFNLPEDVNLDDFLRDI